MSSIWMCLFELVCGLSAWEQNLGQIQNVSFSRQIFDYWEGYTEALTESL
jgi:hypothetical protein